MTLKSFRASRQHGSILGYYIILLIVLGALASVAGYVVQHIQFSKRRSDRKNALEFAEGAALIASQEIEKAYTNGSTFFTSLGSNSAGAYTLNSALSSSSTLVYGRTVSAPFSNQTVQVQVWTTNTASPTKARVVASAQVGSITRTSVVYMAMQFGFGAAAIISDNDGDSSTGVSKSTAQDGNVVVSGGKSSSTCVSGGILANGKVNVDAYAGVATNSISQTNRNTANAVPDYTDEGSPDQLFDFNRFIAVAKANNSYYSNMTAFIAAAKATTLEGVVAVDIKKGSVSSIDSGDFPSGINIRGTLLFNFTGGWAPDDKLANTAAMNINAANLSGLVVSNSATYTTGYPPTFTNPAMSPVGTYPKFESDEDLPALMYNIGILDMHGPVNICGVVYSPSFMEIENKVSGNTQYFNGSLIGGGGIYIDNGKSGSKTVVAYDANALNKLATSGSKGKTIQAYYRK